MTKLTDTQAIILSTAAQRPDRSILPLPDTLRGGAATKVMNALAKRGLIEETQADPKNPDHVWKQTGNRPVISKAGLDAIEMEPEDEGGASINEIVVATGWQSHTVRGAMSGALKKKLGLTIVSDKPEDGPRRYRIEG